MINLFKTLNPLNVLWLAILLFIVRAGYIFNIPDKIEFAFAGPVCRKFQVHHYNLLSKPTFLPALMYVTVSGLFTPFLVLSPPLVCNFLVIWMLFKLFSFYKNKDSKSAAYDLGIIVAIGSIIYLPFIYLFLAILIGLIIFKPFNWREMAAGVIGYVTVFLTTISYLFRFL